MINLPSGLSNILKSNDYGPLKTIVYLYRNKWDEESQSYKVESAPINITDKLVKTGSLTLQLDISEINRYDASNVTFTFSNVKNEFVEGMEGSLFPEGYLLYGSKFEYYVGSSDDLKILMYTGTVTELPIYRPEEYTAEIKVVSELELFKNKECSEFSNKVNKEKLIGLFPDFKTVNIGVGNILKVYAGTDSNPQEELTLGVDYKISDLNIMLSSASIEIINEKLSGKIFYADYYYWKTNLKVDEVVHGLLDVMQVPLNKRNVEQVDFNTEVKNVIPGTNISLGLGYYKTSVQDYNFNWSNTRNSNWNYIYYSDNKGFRQSLFPSNFTINFDLYFNLKRLVYLGNNATYLFADTYNPTATISCNNGLVLRRENAGSTLQHFYWRVYKSVNGSESRVSQLSYETHFGGIRVKDGKLYLFDLFGNTLYEDTLWFQPKIEGFFSVGNAELCLDNYRISFESEQNIIPADAEAFSGPTLLTPVFDKLSSTDNWGQFSASLNGTDFTYDLKYAVSEDGVNFKPWQSVDINTNVGASERYIKFWFSLINPPPSGTDVLNLDFTYLSNTLTFNFVNLKDKTILEGMEDLALISGYEFGFTRDNTFFFKQRIKSTEAVKVLTDNEIIKVSTVKKNLNTLFTKIQLDFGGTPVEVYTNDLETTRPTLQDKYGILTKTIDKPDLLNYDNPELANAIAPQLLETFGRLKNNISVTGVLDLSLDLGDIISLRRNAPLTVNKKSPDYLKYEKTQTYYKACKIIGLIFNIAKRQMTYTLLDVSNENTAPQYEFNEFKYLLPVELGVKE